MTDYTHHGRKRKPPIFWVPESFHPENKLPPRLLPHCQSAYYLMHAIIVRVAFGERDCARLKMRYLRNVLGARQAEPILSALVSGGDVLRVGNFIQRSHSFGYLPAAKYKSQNLRRFHPTDPELLGRLANVHDHIEVEKQRYRKPIHNVWERWQTHLRIDTRQARRVITRLPAESNPYDTQTLLVERIRRREHRFIVDPYGRVHNSITSLHRWLRQTLRIQRQPLASLDIVNSQPAMLALLLHGCQGHVRGVKSGLPGAATIYDATPFTPLVGESENPYRPLEGYPEYRELARSGRLYEHLMDKTGLSRADVKVGMLRDVFGKRGRYPSVVEQVFRQSFPGVWSFVRRFNCDDHGALLKELQRVESELVIHRVGERLASADFGPCVSLHDSVFCRRDELACVQEAFQRQFDAMGFALKLKAA